MTSPFLAGNPDADIAGYIGVGLWAGGPESLNTNLNLLKVRAPVIDVYAENDRDAQFAPFRKRFVSDRFVHVPIACARHDYRGCDNQASTQSSAG